MHAVHTSLGSENLIVCTQLSRARCTSDIHLQQDSNLLMLLLLLLLLLLLIDSGGRQASAR
jgi:hypothetical protein